MSVQAGLWNLDGTPVDLEFLKRVGKALERHGPDGEYLETEGPVGFLYRAFHTTPESRRESQPYTSRNGCLITWDGRVDNRDDLIAELRADVGPEVTDVALVAACFDRWGADSFKRIIGDWTISVWNAAHRKLILARDYVGIRHLYYLVTPTRIVWCTELEALVLTREAQLTLSDTYIAGFLFLWPEAQLSPYEEIQPVPPGSFVQFTNGKIIVQRYWELNQRRISYRADSEYEEHFRHVFRQAIHRRLRSDSPILAELSGGLDSSSIVCVADDIIGTGAGVAQLDTTSRYDPNEPGGDERPYFSRVEARRGRVGFHVDNSKIPLAFPLRFHEFVATPGSMGNLPQDCTNEALRLLRESRHRVVLSGTGGDEVMGGIPDPGPQLADLILTLRWHKLGHELIAWSLVKRQPWVHLLCHALVLCLPLRLRIRMKDENRPMPWLQDNFLLQYQFAVRELGRSPNSSFQLPTRRDYAQTIAALSRQMALTSLRPEICQEKRYPYLDQSLIEFLFSIPPEQLLRPGQRRSLLRRALAEVVPNEILSRSTKSAGGRVYMAVFENQWQDIENLFRSPISACMGYINAPTFLIALRAAKNGYAPHLVRLLRGISLEIWLQDLEMRGVIQVPLSRSWVPAERSAFRNLVPD